MRLVVPFTPGGVTDTGARVVGERLGARLGQQVVIGNRPGALGSIGTQAVTGAPPDGHTLVLGFDGTLVIHPHAFAKVPFDTLQDVAPVSKIGDTARVIVPPPSVPAKTLSELLAYSKSLQGPMWCARPESRSIETPPMPAPPKGVETHAGRRRRPRCIQAVVPSEMTTLAILGRKSSKADVCFKKPNHARGQTPIHLENDNVTIQLNADSTVCCR